MPTNSTITLDPGWYHCVVKDVSKELTKSDDSTNYLVDLIIIFPKKFEGASLLAQYNEIVITN